MRSKLFYIILLGLIIRVFLNGFVKSNDADSFVLWAQYLAHNSIARLYEQVPGGYLPYPPLYYYILAPIGKAMEVFNLFGNHWLALLIVKMPVFIFEILTTFCIFEFTKKYVSKTNAIWSAAFYFLNPAIFLNTSVWGQIDSIVIALVFGAIYFITENKYFLALGFVTLSLLFKLQSFSVTLLFAVWAYISLKFSTIIKYSSVYLVVAFLMFAPVIATKGLRWTGSYFLNLPNQYPYTSVYAYNLFSIRGFLVSDKEKILNLLTYRDLGLLIFFTVSIFICYTYIRKKTKNYGALVFATSLLFFAFFLFNSRMHSRYIIYTLGFIAPFALRFPFLAILMTLFVLLNLALPQTAGSLAVLASSLAEFNVRMLVVAAETVTFFAALLIFIQKSFDREK